MLLWYQIGYRNCSWTWHVLENCLKRKLFWFCTEYIYLCFRNIYDILNLVWKFSSSLCNIKYRTCLRSFLSFPLFLDWKFSGTACSHKISVVAVTSPKTITAEITTVDIRRVWFSNHVPNQNCVSVILLLSLITYLLFHICLVWFRIRVLSISAISVISLKLITEATTSAYIRCVPFGGHVFETGCTSVILLFYIITYPLLYLFLVRFWLRVIFSLTTILYVISIFLGRSTIKNNRIYVSFCLLLSHGLVGFSSFI